MHLLSPGHTLPLSPLSIKSFPIKSPNFLSPLSKSKILPIFCSISNSPTQFSQNCNGWDEFDLLEAPTNSVDLKFLKNIGLDDSKHAFTFFLGFVSALVVSRVRFSFMVIFPASILVFVGGYMMGVAKIRSLGEKVRILEGFLSNLMSELGNGVLDRGKVEGYVKEIEGFVKKIDLGGVVTEHLGYFDLGEKKKVNVKTCKKRKEFDVVQYFSDLFKENVIGSDAMQMKDNAMGEVLEQLNSVAKNIPKIIMSEEENEGDSISKESEVLFNKNSRKMKGNDEDNYRNKTTHNVRRNNSSLNAAELKRNRKSYYSKDRRFGNDMLSYEEEFNDTNRNLRFTTKQESYQKRVVEHNYATESMDFVSAESNSSSLLDENLEMSDNACSNRIRESTMKSTSTISVDEQFNQYVEEATNLLKQAKECTKGQIDEETDSILYKSAKLLSEAETMKPMSLLVVGQLGNTYLLHGELKLKISKELRSYLSRSDSSLKRKRRFVNFKKLSDRELNREDVESNLVEVCEECEELLIEAGRKYRTALSIDGSDVRALYNWGLALSFRAQLIADIGPEAALDADRIYLAAIDKFDALMSRSNLYAPDALYRWGVVLQQRSYIRPQNNRDKIKLLHQAKSLFEDVLSMESDNLQVRQALVSCVSELNSNGQW